MIVYASLPFQYPTYSILVSDPTGGGSLPELVAGPYGFLVVIVTCAFWGIREWRKGRELDVAGFKQRAIQAEERADTLEEKNNNEVTLLTSKIEALQSDIRALRDQHFREQESTTAKYYAARQMLLAAGIPKEEIP